MNGDHRDCGCLPGCGCDGGCNGRCDCAGACAQVIALGAPSPRPGLDALDVRIGDYGRFSAAATQALSSPAAPELQGLGTRDPSDPAMALIDAWAMAADVLTFYRERLTNEGYLRCARDERSLRWLAAEVGYKPRPGVAATAWLAYTMDANAPPVQIKAGAKAQSSPNSGEQMQTFQTLEALDARAEWSAMRPRQTRMPTIDLADALSRENVKLAGTAVSARPGERLLFVFGYGQAQQVVREVASSKVDVQNGWVDVTLAPRLTSRQARDLADARQRLAQIALGLNTRAASSKAEKRLSEHALIVLTSLFLGVSASDTAVQCRALLEDRAKAPRAKKVIAACVDILRDIAEPKPAQRVLASASDIDAVLDRAATAAPAQPRSSEQLNQSVVAGLQGSGGKRGALLKQAVPGLGDRLYQAWRSVPAVDAPPEKTPEVFIMRVVTSPYGATAPRMNVRDPTVDLEWPMQAPDRQPGAAYLDSVVANISPGSLALVDVPAAALPSEPDLRDRVEVSRLIRLARVASTQVVGRSDYMSNSRVTRLNLVDPEEGTTRFQVVDSEDTTIGALRQSVYVVQSESVNLAAQPIEGQDVSGSSIALDSLLDGIDAGRWIIVRGERTDIAVNGEALPGIVDGELALVAGIQQKAYPDSPGDALHTVLTLATRLAFTYKRSTVKIYGNVVKASHGEPASETIGSGSASARMQRFALQRAPLTFMPAVTTSGVQGTQQIRVNNVLWHEVDSLLDAGSTDRVYEMAVDRAGIASFTFGDGVRGARLPSGQGNVRAAYRAGIGAVGNVGAGKISQLVDRPMGVNAVANPLAATGGADRDGSERIRANAPLAALTLTPLSRLVSVADYACFARRYAGVGQAVSAKLADGAFECVHVTLAGVDDAPLAADDALVASLREAYAAFGDPALPVVVDIRELVAMFIQARVAVLPDHEWETVEPALRRQLLDVFSFDRRRLGQSAYLSEVIGAIQSVAGVDWVDVDVLGGISESGLRDKDLLKKAVDDMQTQITSGRVQSVVPVRLAKPAAGDAGRPGPAAQTGLLPAQVAYLLPGVPGTLVLNRA